MNPKRGELLLVDTTNSAEGLTPAEFFTRVTVEMEG